MGALLDLAEVGKHGEDRITCGDSNVVQLHYKSD